MIYVFEFGNARSSFGFFFDFIEVINNPTNKFTTFAGIFKNKNRSALHRISHHRCFNSAR